MTRWFDQTIVETGRLPLFLFLIAFVLTFLFIRVSVRMIRAEVSWWPGNVTPGGVHMHHEFFGVMLLIGSGFGLLVLSRFDTPIADCVLAALFGIGCALVLDEFALILHLRDVYWAEEGRASVDAVFVAIAIGVLFLLGLRPLGFPDAITEFADDHDVWARVAVIAGVALNVALAIITLLKGKLWTGLVGMFVPILLVVGAIRVARPASPWARWRYTTREQKYDKAVRREIRFREPLMRWKVVAQEAIAGRFGVPDDPPDLVPVPAAAPRAAVAPNALATAIRWRRIRRRLRTTPAWRLPVVLVVLAMVAALVCSELDSQFGTRVDSGTLATILGVIAGAMATLTGLVFTAVTLAMQFGGAQISVRVIPMLQREPVMRWSIGFFLATFVFSVTIAIDLVTGDDQPSPRLSTAIAAFLTVVSAFLFIALVARVGTLLNASKLLQWIASDGRGAVLRQYPATATTGDSVVEATLPATTDPVITDDEAAAPTVIRLGRAATRDRVLLAVNVARMQRLAVAWDVRLQMLVSVGDFVAEGVAVVAVHGTPPEAASRQVLRCLLFGDMQQPSVSPTASLQAISDIALKAISGVGNDPTTAVQSLDHIEELLLLLAARLRTDADATPLVVGYQRGWADFVAIGTDEIRRHSGGHAPVQRRLRALFDALLDQCADDQRPPVEDRIRALDQQVEAQWSTPLDRRLARAADRQGYGSQTGRPMSC
ncbi:DUF2254 family protein [Gordonia sp. NPDC003425]